MTEPTVQVVHLNADGSWAQCLEPKYTVPTLCCDFRLHLSGVNADELNAMPRPVLLDLLEAVDPPDLDEYGDKIWFDHNDEWHREGDLPALINNGTGLMLWYRHGYPHRDYDRPAAIHPDGKREWWVDGELHREQGPAIIRGDGRTEWYLRGEEITDGSLIACSQCGAEPREHCRWPKDMQHMVPNSHWARRGEAEWYQQEG